VVALLALTLGLLRPAWRWRAARVALALMVVGTAALWWTPLVGGAERLVFTALTIAGAVIVWGPRRTGRTLDELPGLTLNLAFLVMYLAALLMLADVLLA
jgi:hypothetical protein